MTVQHMHAGLNKWFEHWAAKEDARAAAAAQEGTELVRLDVEKETARRRCAQFNRPPYSLKITVQ